MTATATAETLPKRYLNPQRRQELIDHGDMELVYMAEGREAAVAGDMDAAWAWMALVKLPPTALKMLKTWNGSQFIKDKGLDTSLADAELGAGWLDKSNLSDEEKQIIEARQSLVRKVEDLYIALQENALGIKRAQNQKREDGQ